MADYWRWVALFVCVATGACSSSSKTKATSQDAGACQLGDTRSCTGPGACAGGQVCNANGTWSACDCGTAGSGGGGAGGASGGAAGASGGSGGTAGASGGVGGTSGSSGTSGGGGTSGSGGGAGATGLPNGSACSGSGAQCASGHCTKGVCCSLDCGGKCSECNANGENCAKPGADSACPGVQQSCSAVGECSCENNAKDGNEPDVDCGGNCLPIKCEDGQGCDSGSAGAINDANCKSGNCCPCSTGWKCKPAGNCPAC